jgi:DNA mismatch endonuclease (patch repair protein)
MVRKMSPEMRRRIMASIRKTNTRPELALRSALWEAGLRGWRCHLRTLPGTPDVAFTRWRVAIHVDGVWWHGHPEYFVPGKRGPYWDKKIERNKARDIAVDAHLKQLGWMSIRFWDQDVLKDPARCVRRIRQLIRRRGQQALASARS